MGCRPRASEDDDHQPLVHTHTDYPRFRDGKSFSLGIAADMLIFSHKFDHGFVGQHPEQSL